MKTRTYVFTFSNEAFINLVIANITYYAEKMNMTVTEVFDMMFEDGTTVDDLAKSENCGDSLRCAIAAMEALTC